MSEPSALVKAPPQRVLRMTLSRLLANFYAEAPPALRLKLLATLLQPVGPLALVAISAGAFARLLPRRHFECAHPTLDDARRVNADQVQELVQYVQQKCPEWLLQLPQQVGDTRQWLATFNGTMLWLALQALNRRLAAVAPTPSSPPMAA